MCHMPGVSKESIWQEDALLLISESWRVEAAGLGHRGHRGLRSWLYFVTLAHYPQMDITSHEVDQAER